VDDLIEAFIRFMNSPDDFTGPVNMGNPGEFSILELAEKVISLTGSRSRETGMGTKNSPGGRAEAHHRIF